MSQEPRAHPYGRSAQDVRRRRLRRSRTRTVRIAQIVVFSLIAIVVISASAYALRQLGTPPEEPGVIAEKTLGTSVGDFACPDPEAVPTPPEDVTVQVLNGTSEQGLAGRITEELADRGYQTGSPGDTSAPESDVVIVHGTEGYLAAAAVAAQFPDVAFQLDKRGGADVDVILGASPDLVDADAAAEALTQPAPPPEGCE